MKSDTFNEKRHAIPKADLLATVATRKRSLDRTVHRPPKHAVPAPKQIRLRNCNGLTTLEWLLIVAAVAGLAALAVVLVQNVVDETAEEISEGSARNTAAQVAAAQITSDARSDLPLNGEDSRWTGAELNSRESEQRNVDREYSSKCNRLEITYSDVGVDVTWNPVVLATGSSSRGSRSDLADDNAAWTTQIDASCVIRVIR